MKLIILSRDGILSPPATDPPSPPEHWEPYLKSLDTIARLTQGNFRVVVIAQLPELEDNLATIEHFNRLHEKIHHTAQESGGIIEAIFFTSSSPRDASYTTNFRKALEQLSVRLKLPLTGIPVLSDSLDELRVAAQSGALPIYLTSGAQNTSSIPAASDFHYLVFDELHDVADYLLTAQG